MLSPFQLPVGHLPREIEPGEAKVRLVGLDDGG